MKVLFITNIPSPYRIDFFNEFGKYVDLTVIFEARRVSEIAFNWNDAEAQFRSIYLKEGNITERKVNWRILKYIKRKEYEYIFVTNYGYITEIAAILYMILKKIPYVLEVDGMVSRSDGKLKHALKNMIISKAKNIFSPSRQSDKVLMEYGAKKDVILRYPFSSLHREDILCRPINRSKKQILRRELEIDCKWMVLFVGQFIRRKGIDILLNAVNKLDNNCELHMIGGDYDSLLLKEMGEQCGAKVCFHSFMTKKKLEKYYMAADIFVLPTREDVWGLVINEAMAKGLPIVTTTQCGSGQELVDKNGLLIEGEDPDRFADAINKMLSDHNALETMSRESIIRIANYTIEESAIVHKNYLLYDSVVLN